MNLTIRKFLNRFLYQKSQGNDLRNYEVSVLCAFRSLLSESQKNTFDMVWEKEDEIHREINESAFWTWSPESKGGVTLKSHPLDLRLFGSPDSGSKEVALINLSTDKSPLKAIIYYADGVGPSVYFNKNPVKSFDADQHCLKVGQPLEGINVKDLPEVVLAELINK